MFKILGSYRFRVYFRGSKWIKILNLMFCGFIREMFLRSWNKWMSLVNWLGDFKRLCVSRFGGKERNWNKLLEEYVLFWSILVRVFWL